MSDIVERLRARQVTNWVHATGQTPRASGKRTDPLCAAAADEIERLRAEVAGLREDAGRYRWLRPRLFSADFDYNENGIVALVFEMPPSTQFWGDCDMTVDAARKGEA